MGNQVKGSSSNNNPINSNNNQPGVNNAYPIPNNNNNNNIISNRIQPDLSKRNYARFIKYSNLVTAFKQLSINGEYLDYNKFNICISSLFNIPFLPYTYLSERLFLLMDKNSDGKICEKDFIDDMILVLSGTEMRLKLSFNAMLINKNKSFLDVNEIFDFFFNSWLCGFRLIFNLMNNNWKEEFTKLNVYIPSQVGVLESIVLSNKENIKMYIDSTFKQIGLFDTSKGVDFESFRKWCSIDHTIEISYYNKTLKFATNLMCLDNIGFSSDQ